jgi:hypothetical protein
MTASRWTVADSRAAPEYEVELVNRNFILGLGHGTVSSQHGAQDVAIDKQTLISKLLKYIQNG